jgi:PAS domain S-box-containing protein
VSNSAETGVGRPPGQPGAADTAPPLKGGRPRADRLLAEALGRLSAGSAHGSTGAFDLFRHSSEIVLLLAPDGTILELNPAARRLGGTSDAIGVPIWSAPKAPAGDSARATLRAAVQVAAMGSPVRYDVEVNGDPDPVTLDLVLTPVPGKDGRVELILLEGRDVTASRQSEHQLRESEQRYNRIVAIAADAIVSMDTDSRITLFNQGAEQIFGYSTHEVLGRPIDILLPESAASKHHSHIESFAASSVVARRMGERSQIFGRRKNGEVFPAEASISKVMIGGRPSYTAMLRDVSDGWARDQERARLLAEATRAREEAESARERIAFVAESSDALNETLGYDQTLRALGRLLVPRVATFCLIDVIEDGQPRRVEALHADPAMADLIDALRAWPLSADGPFWSRRALQAGMAELTQAVNDEYLKSVARDVEHLEMLRSLKPRSCICVPLIARDQTLGAITVGRDGASPPFTADDLNLMQNIAWRAALAIENARLFRRSQESAAQRDHMLGVVSHDLGNALSAISLHAAALRGPAGERAAERIELATTMRESIDWMRRLIRDLLDISSIEAGRLSIEPQPVDAVLSLARATHMFEATAAGRSVTIHVLAPDELPSIQADEARVMQVLANLIVNALKHTEAGGTITVAAEPADMAVVFTVSDTGPGIPAEDVPRIFDRFFHARRSGDGGGAGLGLAISRGIVEAHGGRIWVETSPGAGATFRFTIPAAAEKPRRPSDLGG